MGNGASLRRQCSRPSSTLHNGKPGRTREVQASDDAVSRPDAPRCAEAELVNARRPGTTYISRGHSCASPRVSRKSSGLKEIHFPTDFTDRDARDFRLSDPKSARLRVTRITDCPDAITSNAAGSGNFIEVYTWANWRIPGGYAIRIRRRLECSPVTPQEQIPPRLGHVLSATKRMGYAL